MATKHSFSMARAWEQCLTPGVGTLRIGQEGDKQDIHSLHRPLIGRALGTRHVVANHHAYFSTIGVECFNL